MKTSIWQIIQEWAKKNWKYLLLVLLVITGIIWISIREAVIKHQTKKIAELEYANIALEKQRSTLELQLKILQSDYDMIQKKSDSMKVVLSIKEKELRDLQKKHKQEIDSLISVPPDTIYKKLYLLYPNYDGNDLRFPFSASQIKPIYRDVLTLPMLRAEYNLQSESLRTCNELNSNYQTGIANLESQISNLQNNIKLADDQVGNYKKEVVILQNRITKKSFWARFWQVATLSATTVIILK